MLSRPRLNIILPFFLFVVAAAPALSQTVGTSAYAIPRVGDSRQIIVKLDTSFAAEVESALPLQKMILTRTTTSSWRVVNFMVRCGAKEMRPLYPGMVRIKKQQQKTEAQEVSEVRRRFAARAGRFRGPFLPPQITRTYVIELDSSAPGTVQQVLARLKLDPDVEYAEQDRSVSISLTPNDPYFSSTESWGQSYDDLWGIKKIGSTAAWDTTAGSGVLVAVVDTGIDFIHPDISGNIFTNTGEIPGNGVDDDGNGYIDDVSGWNFVAGSNAPIDDHGHGTHVSGTVAASGNNGIGVIGVAWQAKIMPLKGLDANGSGWDSNLASAIVYAANNGADVISNSWGGLGYSQALNDAVSYAYNLGAVVIAAAGNSSQDVSGFTPANLADVIAVSATTPDDSLAGFSNYGDKIDVGAPGFDVLSLQASGTAMGTPVSPGYTRADGTSMAAPHVSGVAALILAEHPEYSNEQVRQVLRASATDVTGTGFNPSFGYGRLNAMGALEVTGPLEAKIYTPVEGTRVTAGQVTVTGVASGAGFVNYTLDYGLGTTPSTWTTFATSTSPVSGTLGVFDASAVSNGTYTIRLTATNTAGQGFVDRVLLIVPKVEITDPIAAKTSLARAYKPGVEISIFGSADDPAFQNFRVEWARGVDPSAGWQSTGVTLTGGGLSPLLQAKLATWDTTGITSADYYTVRLVVTGAITSEVRAMVYLEPDLASIYWPRYLGNPLWAANGFVPARNRGGDVRLLVSALSPSLIIGSGHPGPGALYTISPDGSSFLKTDLSAPGYGSLHQLAAGDLDHDGSDEAVVADFDVIHVYREDLSSYTLLPSVPATFWFSPPTIEDLDGDSQLETLAFGSDFPNNTGYVFAWRPNGQLLNSNFPIQVSDIGGVLDSPSSMPFFVGDVDGDGRDEIVVQEAPTASTFTLRIFGNDGSPKTWAVPVLSGVPLAMAAADLDHVGKLQTIVVARTDTDEVVHVFQPDGTERPGWPVTPPGWAPDYLAIGDLDRDGVDEIVISRYWLNVLRADGTAFPGLWPLYYGYGPVVIGDVNGDGLPELITSQVTWSALYSSFDQRLLAIQSDGSILKSWQLTGMNGLDVQTNGVPIIGDFNQSGTAEIGVALFLVSAQGVGGEVSLLDTGTPFHANANDWPMMFQNSRNSGVLRHDFAVSGSDAQTVAAGQSATYTITTSSATYYGHSIAFACTGLPAYSSCAFAPGSVVLKGDSASVVLTVHTTARTVAQLGKAPHSLPFAASLACCLLGLVVLRRKYSAGARRRVALLFMVVVLCMLWAACGSGHQGGPGSSGTPAGTYTIVVTATGNGGVTRTADVVLTVQ